MFDFAEEPGQLYVLATLIPLASFIGLLFVGGLKNIGRAYKDSWGGSLYWLLGGDHPGRGGAYVATAAIACSCLLSVTGLVRFLGEFPVHSHEHDHGAAHATDHKHDEHAKDHDHSKTVAPKADEAWAGRVTFAKLSLPGDMPATEFQLGYRIDHLAAVMFAMVTFIATLIHVFALGYMEDETRDRVDDHLAHVTRRGRYGRFFMYFSLFCFSMLNLVLADNLFQVFVSWELVGACSFFLIGFYTERHTASTAANKAFITNRVGDAGFIIGLMILWTSVGTLNFEDIFKQVRAPMIDAHGDKPEAIAGRFVRAWPIDTKPGKVETAVDGSEVVLFPLKLGHWHAFDASGATITVDPAQQTEKGTKYRSMPYWLLVVAGLGVFLGCVGKSAQFPLQVWLPDAMEGPTPVSALVHSATMVAAGVYLVGRCYPLFTYEVQLTIAYTGAITLFVAATIAVVATDIKKVLAYSTISQLGFMMLALGVGGWVPGLLHLLTHAFFKALLFLGSGSVIHGCHHQQDMRKMGGLYPKMRITALTMLVGVLAIAGTPFFSGWYSKDAIVAQAVAFVKVHQKHFLLLVLPLVTAGITCFYMFRMWYMTFTGEPKDHHVYDHAHESPRVMTTPLIVLACFSLFVAWGWPLWNPDASALGKTLHAAEPASVAADFVPVEALLEDHEHGWVHPVALLLSLTVAGVGAIFGYLIYYRRSFDPADAVEQFPGVYRLLVNKWYFDDVYSAVVVRPALTVAHWFRRFDANAIDRFIDGTAATTLRFATGNGKFDAGVIDGLVNVLGNSVYWIGSRLRGVQTGFLRSYVLFLVLAAVTLFAALSYFVSLAAAK
ncbi:MAG: NADH-quinone oxidoreductase subunit L [Gemmataceae bacterium]